MGAIMNEYSESETSLFVRLGLIEKVKAGKKIEIALTVCMLLDRIEALEKKI